MNKISNYVLLFAVCCVLLLVSGCFTPLYSECLCDDDCGVDVTVDFEGVLRPRGSGIDIGPFEK